MRIAIITDAWAPQINGVVRTLQSVSAELVRMGHEVEVIGPNRFATGPCPTFPESGWRWCAAHGGKLISSFGAEAIHLATEGPLCLAARLWCLRRKIPFTTAYHTNFPDYVESRTGLSAEWFLPYFRWFHGPATAVLASTPSIRAGLHKVGIRQTHHWGRGVDLSLFKPEGPAHPAFAGLKGPILLHVGRVAIEKNIEAFLSLDTPGTKVVVGDGPARAALSAQYPEALFLGLLQGETLASAYRGADLLVFPSRTDTFGLVMIEALASGTPVAAYPVMGPVDVLNPDVGAMDERLDIAVRRALACDRAACAAYGAQFTWGRSAREFLSSLHVLQEGEAACAA